MAMSGDLSFVSMAGMALGSFIFPKSVIAS